MVRCPRRERLRRNIGQYPATSLADAYKRVLEKYLQPKLGTKKLADISCDEITGIIHPLAHSEKRNTLAVGRTFFRWCVRPPRRYLKHSPLEALKYRRQANASGYSTRRADHRLARYRQAGLSCPTASVRKDKPRFEMGGCPLPRRRAGSFGHRWRQANRGCGPLSRILVSPRWSPTTPPLMGNQSKQRPRRKQCDTAIQTVEPF